MICSRTNPIWLTASITIIAISSSVSLMAQEPADEPSSVVAEEPKSASPVPPTSPDDFTLPSDPQRKLTRVVVDNPPTAKADDQSLEESATNDVWTTSKLEMLLAGRADPPKGWPKEQVAIRTRREVTITSSDGETITRPAVETLSIDPQRTPLSTVHRHAICVVQFDGLIGQLRKELDGSSNADEEQAILNRLANAYSARFKIDTVYQDMKVREIEERAQKLRNELTERDEAEKDWVKAMMTLAEMRADGIDPMQNPPSVVRTSSPVSLPSARQERGQDTVQGFLTRVDPRQVDNTRDRRSIGAERLQTHRLDAGQSLRSAITVERQPALRATPEPEFGRDRQYGPTVGSGPPPVANPNTFPPNSRPRSNIAERPE